MGTRALLRLLVLVTAGCVGGDVEEASVGVEEDVFDDEDVQEPEYIRGKMHTSKLWGEHGGRWSPTSRLPDFSFAGYGGGEDVPRLAVVADVTDFGARGDGRHDDTRAFQDAIDATRGGALFIPRGRYRIEKRLEISHSNIVLRGEGAGKRGSVLYFPKHLRKVYGPDPSNPNYWSYNGGFIWVRANGNIENVTRVTDRADRGSRRLLVDDASELEPGMIVAIEMRDDRSGDLREHLYDGQVRLGTRGCSPEVFRTLVQIDRVDGREVRLVQPLRLDVRPGWEARIVSVPFLRDVGIEDLRIEFPEVPWAGHLNEPGYNGIAGERWIDGWVKNVTFENADNGIDVSTSKWLTFSRLAFRGRHGHHGVTLERSSDILVHDVYFAAEQVHELSVTSQAHGNAFSRVKGSVLVNLDHHGNYPFENLFTDFGDGVDISYVSGGGDPCKGPHSGARGTFWNVNGAMTAPEWGYIQTNVVGNLHSSVRAEQSAHGPWYEEVHNLYPPDLRRAQRAVRSGDPLPIRQGP